MTDIRSTLFFALGLVSIMPSCLFCVEKREKGKKFRPSWGRISTWFVYLPLKMKQKHVENSWFTGRLRASHQSICWSGSWQTQSLACSYFQRPIERFGSLTRVYYPWLQGFFRSWESPLHNCFFLVFSWFTCSKCKLTFPKLPPSQTGGGGLWNSSVPQ